MIGHFKERVAELVDDYVRLNNVKDSAYTERNKCVACVVALAKVQGYRCGLSLHDPMDVAWEHEWRNIVFVDLPTGQVSWHIHDSQMPLFTGLPYYAGTWDGHTTEEKYKRLEAFVDDILTPEPCNAT